MAVIKTLKGQTVVTVVCNIVYPDPPPLPPPDPHQDTLIQHIHKMASAWRVVAFFLIVFVVPVILIALPLYARYTLYPARSLAMVAADTFDLHQMASSFWCQGQRMSSNGTFDAYLLPSAPELNTRRRRKTTVSKVLAISEIEPETRMTHLLKGSSFSLGVCSRWPGGTVIVVRGKENFDRCYYKEEIDDFDVRGLPDRKHREPVLPNTNKRIPEGNTKSAATEARRAKVQNILPISEDDFGNTADSGGGEIFDDDNDDNFSPQLINRKTWAVDNDVDKAETTTIRLLDTAAAEGASSARNDVRYSTKTSTEPSTTKRHQNLPSSARSKNERTRNRNKNSDKKLSEESLASNDIDTGKLPEDESRIIRVLRSIISQRDRDDSSTEIRKRQEEQIRKLELLHSINDTVEVTAGNSSISSSEEFMAHCDNTILMIDLPTMIDCQLQNLSQESLWSFTVNETDDYYFIFMSDNSLERNIIKFYLELDRVMYNVSDNTDVCNNITECSFPFKFFGSQAVVVEMTQPNDDNGDELLSDLSSYEMQAVCQPRVAVYMVFILMVPFIILMFAFQ